MADIKISELPEAEALDGTEQMELVQDGVNVKATAEQLRAYIGVIEVVTQAEYDALTPPDADTLYFIVG